MAATRAPRLEPAREPWTAGLEAEGDYELLAITGDLSGQDADGARLVDCLLDGCAVDGLVLDHAHLVDTTFAGVHGGVLEVRDATWRGVVVRDCRLGALQAHGGRLEQVTVTGGKVDFLNLRGATLDEVVLDGVTIGDLDLGDARVRRLTVTASRLDRLGLGGATLAEVDLRGADLRRVDGVTGLAGATIGELQLLDLAPALAEALRITVG